MKLARLPTASTTHAPPLRGPARLDPSLEPKAIRRAHFRLGHRAPGKGGRRARTVSGCVNSAFLNISQHFTAHLFSPWIPSSARDRRRTLTIQRGGAQRTLSAGSWFEQGLLAHQSTAVNRSRTQSRTTAGLPGRPACVSTRAGFSRCFPIGCRPLFKLFGGDLGADGRRDLEDVLDLIIGQNTLEKLWVFASKWTHREC